MPKTVEVIKSDIKEVIQKIEKDIFKPSTLLLQKDLEDFEFILQCLKRKTVVIGPCSQTSSSTNCSRVPSDVASVSSSVGDEASRNSGVSKKQLTKKKRGRKSRNHSYCNGGPVRSESSEKSLNDSQSSSSSTRSSHRRAADEVAITKDRGQSSLKQKKLRRSNVFDETYTFEPSLQLSTSKKYKQKQSAGSSLCEATENLIKECTVEIVCIKSPEIRTYMRDASSCKRKSEDLFNDLSDSTESGEIEFPPKKLDKKNKKDHKIQSGKSCCVDKNKVTEEPLIIDFQEESEKLSYPLAYGSPVEQLEGRFESDLEKCTLGKDVNVGNGGSRIAHNSAVEKEEENKHLPINKLVSNKSNFLLNRSKSLALEEVSLEIKTCDSRRTTNVNKIGKAIDSATECIEAFSHALKNKNTETQSDYRKKESSENNDCMSKNLSPEQSTCLKVQGNNGMVDEGAVGEGCADYNERLQTKNIKMENINNESPEDATRNKSPEAIDPKMDRARTRIIKREGETNINIPDVTDYLASEFKDKKHITTEFPRSPAPIRGEFVKQKVNQFEQKQSQIKKISEEASSLVRVTRQASKLKSSNISKEKQKQVNMAVKKAKRYSLEKELQREKANLEKENIPYANKMTVSASKVFPYIGKCWMTPLGNSNHATPKFDSGVRDQIVNYHFKSAVHLATPEESQVSIKKQLGHEQDKKSRREKIMKIQEREEEAKKKKENALKAQVEEAKRKREEKQQKVLAAKEAAERKNLILAEVNKKIKEDKLMAAAEEKKKKNKEMLKKKTLAQQKALEQEERRKQDTAARLAKLKEQEEEYKRALALKERLQEAEKANKALKNIANNNNKDKTESPRTSSQSLQSYEITPSREDRVPIKPKSENDYGIEDAQSEDSSDDERNPKKQIPLWAQAKNRLHLVTVSSFIPQDLWDQFMGCIPCTPDVNQMFSGVPIRKRQRTSSAVWHIPPVSSSFFVQK